MSHIVAEQRVNNYIARVFYDDCPINPRGYDNVTTIICFHGRYNLGDETSYRSEDYDSWAEMKEAIMENEKPLIIKPLYLYDHSGITISTSPFGCKWDSGQIGWVYVTKERMEELGVAEEYIEFALNAEVGEYDHYLRGEVYRWEVVEVKTCELGHEHTTFVDSCGGYNNEDDAMEQALLGISE